MSLTTYAGLQAAIASWFGRSDTATLAPDFIALAEARIGRELRVDQMLKRETATITGEFGTVPTDFLAPLSMRLTTGCKPLLRFLTSTQMAALQQTGVGGPVQAYSRINGEFWFYPVPGGADQAELIYYAAIPALSSANPSNWLLASHPDVYLRGAMLEAALFYEDDDLIPTYSQLFEDAIGAVMDANRRDAQASNLSMTPSGMVV
jgi:hypothetical protein